jgi:hypothetical protein
MSDWSLFNLKLNNFSDISWREQVNFQWDYDEVRFVLDQHAELDFNSARSQYRIKSTGKHVASLAHIYIYYPDHTHIYILSWFPANQSLLFLLKAAHLAGKQHIPIL